MTLYVEAVRRHLLIKFKDIDRDHRVADLEGEVMKMLGLETMANIYDT